MKFPLSIIDIAEHQNYIYNLLNDDDTLIFIDTNIIALIYRLNNKSRDEFFNWIKPFIDGKRIKVPNWVVNEYTNRFIRDKIFDYLSPLSSLKSISKEYNNVFDFLNMHVDEEVVLEDRTKTYTKPEDLKKDIFELKKLFNRISFITKNKNSDYVHKIHNKIETIFHTCHIDSNLDSIFKDLNRSSQMRYNHKFPPGFDDAKKELNEYGDLIIWKEILEYSKNNHKKKVIFLTNDEKKDWVYPPIKVVENGRTRNNSDPKYKIIDPRLIHEFFINTGSEEIEIVSFENFIKILIHKLPGNFIETGRALQLMNMIDNTQHTDESLESKNEADEIVESNENETNKTKENTDNKNSDYQMFDIQETGFKDKYIDLSDNDFLTGIINDLKSYNWYVQNPAIDLFIEKIKAYNFTYSSVEQTKLFVIGRNIYQAACGSSASAVSFINENLFHFLSKNNDYIINLIVSGMVYEIYFNSENKFRSDRLKSQFINELELIEENPRLIQTKEFILKSLIPFKNELIYLPFSGEQINIDVYLDEMLIEIDDWLEGKQSYQKLASIKYKDYELLADTEENSIEFYQSEFTKLGIENLLCKSYAIPSNKLKLRFENYKENYKISFDTLKLKKNWI